MSEAHLLNVDAVTFRVPDLDAGFEFSGVRLGHEPGVCERSERLDAVLGGNE